MFKQMSRLEMESFKTCASKYFDYIHAALKVGFLEFNILYLLLIPNH